jgi:dynein heavy chain 2
VLRAGRPCLDPPPEELRLRHYRDHLVPFLGLPAKMRGVSDLSERPGFFRWVADADPDATAKVHGAQQSTSALCLAYPFLDNFILAC